MTLELEINQARKEIVSDGYDMSFGEVMNLYKDNELTINPDFQRLFRWDDSQRTRFIESLLLGIPVPPIFVYQNTDGIWELIDGLQRLSTVLQFAGMLHDENGVPLPPLTLSGTKYLPGLADKRWEQTDSTSNDGIGKSIQLTIKRARIRVEILKKESDPNSKYELFQRLNTGGSKLSEQEVRNCVAVMINPPFKEWLFDLSSNTDFLNTIAQTEDAIRIQANVELAFRFIAFRNVTYTKGLDVHEYLDEALISIASDPSFDMPTEGEIFNKTFKLLNRALNSGAFKKWDGSRFTGKFLMSLFEVVSIGVSKQISEIEKLTEDGQIDLITSRVKALWSDTTFLSHSGAGTRGTTRLVHLLPLSNEYFRP
ncbi:DUF262 domain-containing protein [Geothrix terrae]|uniref:DUF262 domain-containing protein n=1 Tax=Geothrix terrae TaxID=2922720 RepID=UPI001FAB4B3A|nr:DUF262 domain-containing protein [Geothrix terrae]